MSAETGYRTIIARSDGGVSILAAVPQPGAASVDAVLSRAEAKAATGVVVDRVALKDAPSDRSLRNAWVIADGKIAIDLEKARAMKAEQWGAEGSELRDFITKRLLPAARILGQRGTIDRLNAALQKIEAAIMTLEMFVPTMTEAELASHKPDWPQLSQAR